MKKNILISLVLSSLLALSSNLFAQDSSSVVNANNQFAFDLYSRYKLKDGNIFFSPYSISSALAMTYEGARGKTADEIQAVFHFPKDEAARREALLKINDQINKKDKKYQLSIANALWAQKGYNFLDNYLKLVEKYYNGKAANLDFIKETEKSRVTINKWVKEKTNDKIKDLIPKGGVTTATHLVLTNAIYFKGFWFKQFDKKDTKEENFRVSPGNMVKSQMMCLTGEEAKFNYAETDKLQVLELPYDGEELSMLILLPEDNNLGSVESSLTAEKLSELKTLLKEESVEVFIPKFKFETKYFMKDDLSQMGMPTAFSGDADFSGLDGTKWLVISDVIHQAFVDVNEEGTEAAAATAGILCLKEVAFDKTFRADHPFIFVIQERGTGNILFIGRVVNPVVS